MGKRSRAEEPPEAVEAADPQTTTEVPVDEAPEPESATPSERPEPPPAEPPPAEGPAESEDGRRARVLRFAKRLMDRRELSHDTREILGTVLATSDKAKNEAVRLIAREVRSYLDALEIKEDLKELVTSYSLEISISLKPLAGTDGSGTGEGGAGSGGS